MAEYKGIDRVDKFFEHYGRKGMKRGMNIYNPDYKPVGEKAQGTSDGKIAQRSISAKPTTYRSAMSYKSAMSGDSRYAAPKKSAMSGDSRYSAPKSAADRQREAMNHAAGAATTSGAKSTREKLLEAERKRQAKIIGDKYGQSQKTESAKESSQPLSESDKKKQATAEVNKRMKVMLSTKAKELGYDYDKLESTRQEFQSFYDSLRPSEKGYAIQANNLAMRALGGSIDDWSKDIDVGDTEFMSYVNTVLGLAAGSKGLSVDDFLKSKGATDEEIAQRNKAANEGDRLIQKRTKNEERNRALRERGLMPSGSGSVSNEYLDSLEYNTRKNKYFGR